MLLKSTLLRTTKVSTTSKTKIIFNENIEFSVAVLTTDNLKYALQIEDIKGDFTNLKIGSSIKSQCSPIDPVELKFSTDATELQHPYHFYIVTVAKFKVVEWSFCNLHANFPSESLQFLNPMECYQHYFSIPGYEFYKMQYFIKKINANVVELTVQNPHKFQINGKKDEFFHFLERATNDINLPLTISYDPKIMQILNEKAKDALAQLETAAKESESVKSVEVETENLNKNDASEVAPDPQIPKIIFDILDSVRELNSVKTNAPEKHVDTLQKSLQNDRDFLALLDAYDALSEFERQEEESESGKSVEIETETENLNKNDATEVASDPPLPALAFDIRDCITSNPVETDAHEKHLLIFAKDLLAEVETKEKESESVKSVEVETANLTKDATEVIQYPDPPIVDIDEILDFTRKTSNFVETDVPEKHVDAEASPQNYRDSDSSMNSLSTIAASENHFSTVNSSDIETIPAIITDKPFDLPAAPKPTKSQNMLTATNITINDYVILISSDRKRIFSSSSLLTRHSYIFATILKKNQKSPIKINIEEFNAEIIYAALDFLNGKNDVIIGKELQLYRFADKYSLLNLKDVCCFKFDKILCPENAAEIIQVAYANYFEELKQKCIKIMTDKKYPGSFENLPTEIFDDLSDAIKLSV